MIVPTYNERENIARLVTELRGLPGDVNVLIVDDASPDGTGAIVDQMAASDPGIHVIHRAGKLGLGTAYKAGFDFGLAHVDDGTSGAPSKPLFLTRQSEIVGSPAYISPEQVTGDPTTAQTDLYSFGVILFHMLTGRLPITAKTHYQLLDAHVHDDPRTLVAMAPDIAWDPALQGLITRLLHKNPDARPTCAAEARANLKDCQRRMLGA